MQCDTGPHLAESAGSEDGYILEDVQGWSPGGCDGSCGGQDINGGNGVKTTGLMRALAGGHNDLVEVLLHQDRIDINSSDSLGYRALHWASYSGNVTRIRSHWLKILVV